MYSFAVFFLQYYFRIRDKFEVICDNFGIKHLCHVITLQVRKSPSQFVSLKASNDHDDLDNPSLWEECGEEYNADVEAIQTNCRKQILHCFAHSLQLVIRDGLKETKMIHSMLAKVTKLCSLLHTTCGLKEAFEAEFGVNSSVPAAVST